MHNRRAPVILAKHEKRQQAAGWRASSQALQALCVRA